MTLYQLRCEPYNKYEMIHDYVPKDGRKKPVVKIVLGEMTSYDKEEGRLGVESIFANDRD